MRVVYKYPFAHADDVVIEMPKGATVLKVDMQAAVPTLWALVDPAKPIESRAFVMRGTGHPVPDLCYHVDSWFDGPFVWHLFARLGHSDG